MSAISDMVSRNKSNLSQLRKKGMYSGGIFSSSKNYRKINMEEEILLSEKEILDLELNAKKSLISLKRFNRIINIVAFMTILFVSVFLFLQFIS